MILTSARRRSFLFTLICLALLGCQEWASPLAAPTSTPPPPTAVPPPTATPLPDPNTAVGFDYFLNQFQTSSAANRQRLVNQYMAGLTRTPVVGGNRAIFLWQGAAVTVELWGDMTFWDRAQARPLSRLPDTDLWYYAAEFEPDARLDYQFIVNNGAPQLDPRNPHTVPAQLEPLSELRMAAYRLPPELQPGPAVVRGELTRRSLNSAALNQERSFWVYQPAGQIVGRDYPALYLLDGGDFLNLVNATAVLDRLIANGDILPLVVVFSTPVAREQEYRRSEAHAQFLADELVPYIRANFGTTADPGETAVLGAGLGGLAAVFTAVSRPDTFGLAAGLSGFYSLDDEALARLVGRQAAPLGRFYLAAGGYETAVRGTAVRGTAVQGLNIPQASQRLIQSLEPRATAVHYDERPQGHSWGFWRDVFGDALRFFYGGQG